MKEIVEWIGLHQWTVPVFCAAIGLVGAVIGYFYKSRADKKSNLRRALYLQLELWHRTLIFSKISLDKHIDEGLRRIISKLKISDVSKHQLDEIKAKFMPVMCQALDGIAFDGFNSLVEKYESSVQLISESDPIYAYRIEAASSTKRLLGMVDRYFSSVQNELEISDQLSRVVIGQSKEMIAEKIMRETIEELEKTMRGLALKINFYSYLSVRSLISSRHRRLAEVDPEEFDEVIDKIIVPALHEYVKSNDFAKQDSKDNEGA